MLTITVYPKQDIVAAQLNFPPDRVIRLDRQPMVTRMPGWQTDWLFSLSSAF